MRDVAQELRQLREEFGPIQAGRARRAVNTIVASLFVAVLLLGSVVLLATGKVVRDVAANRRHISVVVRRQDKTEHTLFDLRADVALNRARHDALIARLALLQARVEGRRR